MSCAKYCSFRWNFSSKLKIKQIAIIEFRDEQNEDGGDEEKDMPNLTMKANSFQPPTRIMKQKHMNIEWHSPTLTDIANIDVRIPNIVKAQANLEIMTNINQADK